MAQSMVSTPAVTHLMFSGALILFRRAKETKAETLVDCIAKYTVVRTKSELK